MACVEEGCHGRSQQDDGGQLQATLKRLSLASKPSSQDCPIPGVQLTTTSSLTGLRQALNRLEVSHS